MIAALPHDVQGHVWDLYRGGLHSRIRERHRHVASKVVEQIGVLCNKDAEARDYLLDWLAHLLQEPGTKPGKAIALVGREGCGKRMLINFISRLAPTLYTDDPQREVYGRFNATMELARLVVIDGWEKVNVHKLKSLISDDSIAIRERQGPLRSATSHHRVMLLVDEMPHSLQGARRVYPIHCTEACMGSEENAAALHELVTTPALDALREMLTSRRICRGAW